MHKLVNFLLVILFILPALVLQRSRAHAQVGDPWSLIAEVNSLRSSYGLPPYEVNNALMSAAQKHSDYQAQIGTWTHTGSGGSRPHDRAVAAGYGGGAQVFVSENVALGANLSPSTTVYEMWQDAIHLETMISSRYTHIGAGVGRSGDTVYYTIDVGYIAGSPGSGPPPADNSSPSDDAGTPAPTAIPVEPIQVATPSSDGSVIHIVQWGQFLENIANTYEVSLQELMAINGLSQETIIYPGDKLMIVPGETPESTPEETPESIPEEMPETTPEEEGSLANIPEIDEEILSSSPTQTPWSPTRTPTPEASIAIAMEIPKENISSETATPEAVQIPQEENRGADYLLFAVFGLAISGSALILFGSALKRRS
jgi:LysM repeat protein